MRRLLRRFTATPLSGAATGAITTAVIQSSSATTVMAVGFVGAGVLTFTQALGVIFGANIGTTMTGWLVALLGFKLDLGQAVLPLVLVAALLRLLGRGAVSILGTTLAGFSLVFIGIDVLKDGLGALEGLVTPDFFPADTIAGRLKLVGIGIAMTIVTQSSSAGVAAALAAIGAGAINFPQAAALVIGMDIGTTATAFMATLGGTTMARRTGYAHVIYNVLTGTMAFLLLPAAGWIFAEYENADSQISLVAFHSGFNALGVVLVLPFTRQFAHLVEWLVPERGDVMTQRLDNVLLADPATAEAAARDTAIGLAKTLRTLFVSRLGGRSELPADVDTAIATALDETRDFIDRIPSIGTRPRDRSDVDSMYHILDHCGRLHHRLRQSDRIEALQRDRRLRRLRDASLASVTEIQFVEDTQTVLRKINRLRRWLRRQRHVYRYRVIEDAAMREIDAEELGRRLDAVRWLHRTVYHLWRMSLHLSRMQSPWPGPSHLNEARAEVVSD
jgi:phosphate:Na+ symporter